MASLRLERQFGRVVGGVLLAIAGWIWWRRYAIDPVVSATAGVGATLVLLSALRPSWLARPRRMWMALADALACVSTRVILALVFFLAVWPLGFTMRRFGWDPLQARRAGGGWREYSVRQRNPKHFEQMF